MQCAACGHGITTGPCLAVTGDRKIVMVGVDCWKRIKQSRETGYQINRNSVRLYAYRESVHGPYPQTNQNSQSEVEGYAKG